MEDTNSGNYYMQTPANNSGVFDIERWATALNDTTEIKPLSTTGKDTSLNGKVGITRLPNAGAAKAASKISNWGDYDTLGYTTEEALGDNQSNLQKYGNALLNNLVIAGTTAVESSIGLAYGLLNGLAGGSMWDNPVNNAMNSIQERARENNPIYHSRKYNEASSLGRVFTPEFWADNLQNLGFTEGMLISSLVPGALLKNAGVVANVVGKSLISSFGEASTEALNAKNDKKNLEIQQTMDSYRRQLDSLNVLPEDVRKREQQNLIADVQNTLAGIEDDANKVGNAVLYQNLAILTLTGAGEFAPLFSRGAKASAVAANNKLLQKGIKTTLDDASSLTNIAMKEGKGLFIAKDVAKTIGRASLEGVEELSQNVATKVGDLYEGYNSFNNSRFNPEKRELATSLLQAGSMAIAEAVNDKDVWTEFLSGMVTGFTGSPMIRSPKNLEGNWQSPVTLEGAVAEGIRDYREYNNKANIVNSINERLQDPKFNEYYEHLTRDIDLAEKINTAIESADAFNLKNYQLNKIVSDISLFEELGLIDEYKNTVSTFANLDDEQIQSIISETTVQGNGPFVENGRTMRVDEVREKINENANFILNKIDRFIDIKNAANLFLNPKLSKDALENYVYGSIQIEDWQERQSELIDELYTIYSNNTERDKVVTKEELLNKTPEKINEILSSVYSKLSPNNKLDYTRKVEDFNKLSKSIEIFKNKLNDTIKNPEKENKKTEKRKENNIKEAKAFKKKTIEEKLSTVNSFSDIKNILEDETIDAATKDKALRASTNQVAKDYNKLLQAVKATKAKATQLDSQLKSDINKILDNLVDNANTVEDLDSEGVLVADPEILRTDNTENSDDLFIRSQKAVQVIKSVFGDTLRTNEEPIIEITSADGDVPSPDFDDESDDELTTGSQEVPTTKPVNDPANPKEERRTAVIDGVDASIDENGNIDTYLSKEETGAVQQDIETKSKEETKDIQKDTSKKEGNKETLIRPSVSQYDLTGMARNPNGVEFNEVPEADRAARQYLAQNGPEGKDAFEWINEGGLQKYLANKNKLYIGIDPRFSETTPVIFIKNQGNTYSPIAILWESDNKIDSFAGLREITNKVREEYQSNKVENTPYVSPNIEIPAENVNITSGRVAYTNKAKHLVKDAIVDSEISLNNADILVIADDNLVGGTGKARDYRTSGSRSSGMAYISIPNARRGGFRGNTLVPIIPKRYSEVKDSTESFMTDVNAAIQKLAEALNKGDINTYKTDLKKLGDYLTLSYLAIGYQTDEEGNVIRFFFKQIQRNPDGSVVKVNRNGKEVVKSDPISSVAVGASIEEIVAAIENALTQIQVPIRVNKNFVNDKRYNQKLIEQGLVETYATRLKSEAAYFTFTAPTVQQKPVETATESKKEVKPTESNASDDLFDLDNFGVSDVLTKKMVGSTVPIEPTSESLSRYGLELNKEYLAYDIIKALKEASSPISSKVVDLLMRAAREMGIKYTIEKGNGTDFGASRGNQISIYTDPSDSKFTHVVLHETTHSFTSWLLNPKNSSKLTSSEKQTVKEIQSLFELARKNGVTNEFGASTSVDEFVSELANPEFANQLSRIKVEEKKSLLGRLKEKIKELIHKFLGRSYEKQYSNVKDELEKLLEQAISYREVYDSEFLMSNYTREELEILRNAPRDNEGHLLAPNEKPTNLTEKQYAQVRTKAFKDWFGDWINSPSEASKVVDKNGEPLVVYHGNKYSAPITEFKEGFKNTFNTAKKGYYFTDNIEDAKYFSDTEGYSEIAKEQKKYLDNVTNNYKVIYNIENSGKDVIEFYDTDWGPLYVPLKSNNKTSIIKAIKESKEYKQALNDYNRYLEFANSNGQILSVFLNIRDTKNIRDYNITGLGAHQYIAQSPNQIKSATDNNGEFSRTNNNIYYMRPQPKYLGSPQEISNIIDSYRNTYSINREVVQNAVNRINEAAGKTIAKLGRGSLHEGIQAYKVDIIEEPTLDTLWKAHSNSLLEYSKQEVGEPMTEFEKEELINLGYSEDWIETATKDEINYARVCAGV